MTQSKTEKKLLRDISEIESLVTFRHGTLARKPEAQWERNTLLCADRNDLMRFGVDKAFSEVEFFVDGILINYCIGSKKTSFRTKKYRFLEKILKQLEFSCKRELLGEIMPLPHAVSRFLINVENLKTSAIRHLSEMESTDGCRYQGRSIFEMDVFKRFCRDAGKTFVYLTNKLIKTS